ncbi:MAG: dUTP diphosphatase [Kiritimatiellae bacterium]|nr:dUTP diphosphatase [Kiritimatiellia bacterium]
MRVKVLRTDPAAQLPAYAHPGDAGMDVRSVEGMTLPPGGRALVRTGLVLELPPDAEAQVRPRSGLALKHGVTVLNTPGTIDAGYRGEVGVILVNLGSEPFIVEKGMKIAQLVVSPVAQAEVVEVTAVDATDRGAGGFGSTGV